jgi:hypothetical protein
MLLEHLQIPIQYQGCLQTLTKMCIIIHKDNYLNFK